MSASPSSQTWRRVIDQAHDGDARHLLELLLVPPVTDSRGAPMPRAPGLGAFYDLPDDADLRLAIVRALLFGPWKGATTVQELMTKTGWGKSKPSLSDFEVGMADAALRMGVGDVHDLAEGLGIGGETLRKKIDKRRKRRP